MAKKLLHMEGFIFIYLTYPLFSLYMKVYKQRDEREKGGGMGMPWRHSRRQSVHTDKNQGRTKCDCYVSNNVPFSGSIGTF